MGGFHDDFLARFRWIDGHADVLGLLADAEFLPGAAAALADPFRSAGITKVVGIEARGFAFGAAVALELRVGFVGVRKAGAVHPGPKAVRRAGPDWRGRETELVLQRAALTASDVALLVDDWAETGAHALAARALVEESRGRYAGLSLLVDQLEPRAREALEPVAAVVRAAELPPSG